MASVISLTILFILTTAVTPNSIRHHQHHNHLRNSKSSVYSFEPPPQYASVYVRFSSQPPVSPPWISNGQRRGRNRARRSSDDSIDLVTRPACESISRWHSKTEAEDMWGNKVPVVQSIDVNGARVNQYFFETYCTRENCTCHGIDTQLYTSKCKSKHIWAYAKTIDSQNNQGWNLIKLRGSCSCSVTRIDEGRDSLWDDLR